MERKKKPKEKTVFLLSWLEAYETEEPLAVFSSYKLADKYAHDQLMEDFSIEELPFNTKEPQ